mmetsp:Transcript_14367/g.58133  ORF Transcript_14367/g.58133 Transcript_14367/m.58133 type:complete len:171 (-) Transcript_14367:2943-3455(-)
MRRTPAGHQVEDVHPPGEASTIRPESVETTVGTADETERRSTQTATVKSMRKLPLRILRAVKVVLSDSLLRPFESAPPRKPDQGEACEQEGKTRSAMRPNCIASRRRQETTCCCSTTRGTKVGPILRPDRLCSAPFRSPFLGEARATGQNRMIIVVFRFVPSRFVFVFLA